MYWAPNDTCRKEICSSFVYFRPQLIPNNMRKKTTVISSRACVSRKNRNDVTVTSKKKKSNRRPDTSSIFDISKYGNVFLNRFLWRL